MVSFDQNYGKMAFQGLSSDTKPTETYKGYTIKNGSTFYEIDSTELYMYDEENSQWIKQA